MVVSSLEAGLATPDLLIVARPLADMREQPVTGQYEDVSLIPCDPTEAEARVRAIHDELKPSRPELEQWAAPADADTLADAADDGLLFDIRVNGTTAGVIAAERDNTCGFTGFCMQEIALDAAHRGQQIGVAALQRLCRVLPANTHDGLRGHNHAGNAPSLRNA